MTRRSSRRADSHGRAPQADARTDPAASQSRIRKLLGQRRIQALLIFVALVFAYLANGDVLPGQDATGNVRLAGKLVTQRKLVFTPDDDPFMFEWQLKTSAGERPAHFRSWLSQHQGEPIRRVYERGELTAANPYYYLIPTRLPGVYANRYGLGAGLFAAPFVAAVYPFAPDLYQRASPSLLWHTAKVAAACAVAGSAVFLFLAALAFVRPSTAAWLALAYGLGTCVWSSSSQTLWQHGPTELFLALGTFLLLRENRVRSAPWVGLSYTLAFACRPTAALAVAAAAVYYLVRDRRAFLGFAAGCLPVAVLLSVYNLHYFGQWVVLGQLGGAAGKSPSLGAAAAQVAPTTASSPNPFGTSFASGLTGILLSPSRGLLVFSPAIGFLCWGMVRTWRDRTFAALRPVSIAAVAMCLVVARWYGWWGGWCYGYRLLVDAVTLLAFFAIPVAEEIRRRRILLLACGACLAWGFMVQVVGAFAYDVVGWNHRAFIQVEVQGSEPRLFTDPDQARRDAWARRGSVSSVRVDVDGPRGKKRLWTLGDSQILYYLENFLEARSSKQLGSEHFIHDKG